jgi:hypothetical protein
MNVLYLNPVHFVFFLHALFSAVHGLLFRAEYLHTIDAGHAKCI